MDLVTITVMGEKGEERERERDKEREREQNRRL